MTSPSALRPLESQLTVRKSQLMLSAAEATMAPRDGSRRRASVEGAVHAMIESGSVPPIGTDAPDTAMEAVMVMAAVHQGWSGSAKWRAEERRCLQQLLNPVGSVPDCSGEAVSRMQVRRVACSAALGWSCGSGVGVLEPGLSLDPPSPTARVPRAVHSPPLQELWAHRKELWTSSIVPFMHALSAVCPSVAPYASEVDTVVSLPDAFAPAHGRLETPRELLSSPIA